MVKNYEVCIKIDQEEDKKYIDQLIISLVHQGYSVYIGYDKDCVCFTTNDREVTETTKDR